MRRSLEEQFRKRRLEQAVLDLLRAVLTEPTLLCFEDVHWLDDASGDVIRAISADVANQPWLICVTRRRTTTGPFLDDGSDTVSIDLSPLSVDATIRLIETATAGEPLPSHVVRALAERSDGNPLFALELLHALRDEGSLDTLPQSVEGLITARIDRLAPDDRALLRQVSVLGGGFHDAAPLCIVRRRGRGGRLAAPTPRVPCCGTDRMGDVPARSRARRCVRGSPIRHTQPVARPYCRLDGARGGRARQ